MPPPGALILYAAFGSSRHLVTGPMASTAALSAAAVGDMAAGGSDEFVQLTITMALVVGILALVAGALRLGFLASFISEPVLKGFIIGLALTIIVGQLPKLFGVEKEAGDFFDQLWGFLGELGNTSGLTLLVGVCSLVLVLGLNAYAPVVPASLAAVLVGIAAVSLFDLDVDIVGEVDSGLPSFGLPDVAAGAAQPRPTRRRTTTRSTPTASCSAWARRTSQRGSRAGWSSAAACQRPPSTVPRAPALSSRDSSSPG
jgi:MFS superfamily sulfate permease-like transporter